MAFSIGPTAQVPAGAAHCGGIHLKGNDNGDVPLALSLFTTITTTRTPKVGPSCDTKSNPTANATATSYKSSTGNSTVEREPKANAHMARTTVPATAKG